MRRSFLFNPPALHVDASPIRQAFRRVAGLSRLLTLPDILRRGFLLGKTPSGGRCYLRVKSAPEAFSGVNLRGVGRLQAGYFL